MSDAPDFFMPSRQGERDTAVPRFYTEAVHNLRRSEEDGAPRFDDTEYVEILVPGDRKTTSVQMVNAGHKQRWPREYAAFKDGKEPLTTGTPIRELPGITRSQAEELAYQHIHSIESLSSLSDDQAVKSVSMGGFALRDRAKRWLDTTAADVVQEKLAAENREKDTKIAALEAQMADLIKRMNEMPQVQAQPQVPG